MIECVNENVWYKKKKRKKRSVFRLFLFFIILCLIYSCYRFIIVKNLSIICVDYVHSITTKAVNNALNDAMIINNGYQDFVNVEKNNLGDITLISSNSYLINNINLLIVENTLNHVNNALKNGINIPLMAFLGIEILSGLGPNINVNVLNAVSVNSTFDSRFTSVGINQTMHSIYINVNCDVKLHVPTYSKIYPVSVKVLICETVLVGKVPEVYLDKNIFG